MNLFEVHIHMLSRTTDDNERMAIAGIKGDCRPTLRLESLRPSVATFKVDYGGLLGWEHAQATRSGVLQEWAMGLTAKQVRAHNVQQ